MTAWRSRDRPFITGMDSYTVRHGKQTRWTPYYISTSAPSKGWLAGSTALPGGAVITMSALIDYTHYHSQNAIHRAIIFLHTLRRDNGKEDLVSLRRNRSAATYPSTTPPTICWAGRRGTGPCFRPAAEERNGVNGPKNGPVPIHPVNGYLLGRIVFAMKQFNP
jgi:hypothetical protein